MAEQATEGTRLFVGNLELTTDAEALGHFFERFGVVTNATISTRGDKPLGFGFVTMKTKADAETAKEKGDKQVLDGRQLRVEIAREASERPPRRGRGRFSRGPRRGPRRFGGRGQRQGGAPRREDDRQGGAPRREGGERRRFRGGRGPRRFRARRERRVVDPNAPRSTTRVHVSNLPYKLNQDELAAAFKDYEVQEVILRHRRFDTSLNVGYGFVVFKNEAAQKKVLAERPEITLGDRSCRISAALEVQETRA
ncbi:hypothetical protein BLNAU_15039 [Blattamonas nauphoetae]|uniref:RRM domain-containing protein n=1 Tax=Blattamonas nauphoetae TaxID=2049346 RepID=A0ABQ9XGM2_9EUKA|nr:hypothetical protein BLNAU_15039 [Blattamonas nauphoetae]